MKNATKAMSLADLDLTIQGLIRTIFLLEAKGGSEEQVKTIRSVLQEILLCLPEKILPCYLTDLSTMYYQCARCTNNVTYYSHGVVTVYGLPLTLVLDTWEPVEKAKEYKQKNELAAAEHDCLITGVIAPILLGHRKKEYAKYLRNPRHLFVKWQIAKYLDQKLTLPRRFPTNTKEYYSSLRETLKTATKESVSQIESPRRYDEFIREILSLGFTYNSANPEAHTMSAEIPHATHLQQITEEFVFAHDELRPILRYTDFLRFSVEITGYSTLRSLSGRESYEAISRCNEIDRFLQLMDVVQNIASQNQEISQFLKDINVL